MIAPGRNARALGDFARRFGDRVRTVALSGDEGDDRERMRQAAPDAIDCVIDLFPRTRAPCAPPSWPCVRMAASC